MSTEASQQWTKADCFRRMTQCSFAWIAAKKKESKELEGMITDDWGVVTASN